MVQQKKRGSTRTRIHHEAPSNHSARRSSAATHQQGASKAHGAAVHRRYLSTIREMPTHIHQTILFLHHLCYSMSSLITSHHRHHITKYFPPPPAQLSTTDPKSPLAHHLQLAPWPMHYRATPPPKNHGNTDPCKFVMSYETTIALAGRDEATSPNLLPSP
jgi:hypothetical protein